MKAKPSKKTATGATVKRFAVKRFAVFSGDRYYPNGGWRDFRSSHATLAAARRASAPGDWRQIVDLVTGQILDNLDYRAARERQNLKLAAITYANELTRGNS